VRRAPSEALSRVAAVTETSPTRPAPLLVAAAVVGAEALALVVLAVVQVLSLDSHRVALTVTTTLFFLGLAAGLGLCAWGLARVHSWARGPVVACQLIGLFVAFSFWGGDTTYVAAGLGAASLVALAGVLLPVSTAALASAEYDAYPDDPDERAED
jgi:hypothetical protein